MGFLYYPPYKSTEVWYLNSIMATWVIQTIENWRIERFNIQCKVAPIYWLMGLPFNAFPSTGFAGGIQSQNDSTWHWMNMHLLCTTPQMVSIEEDWSQNITFLKSYRIQGCRIRDKAHIYIYKTFIIPQ